MLGASAGQGPIGYMNPVIYGIGTSSSYKSTFHDVSDGSTNLYYPASKGYDLSTGWGSIIGSALFKTLVASATN